MTARLPSELLVGAMLRRVNDAGGLATILSRGDAGSGAILIVALERGRDARILERTLGVGGNQLSTVGPTDHDEAAVTAYWRRRVGHDPDLWVIELDIAEAERLAAETMLAV